MLYVKIKGTMKANYIKPITSTYNVEPHSPMANGSVNIMGMDDLGYGGKDNGTHDPDSKIHTYDVWSQWEDGDDVLEEEE